KLTQRTECLACHATDHQPEKKDKQLAQFHVREGVNCLACHSLQQPKLFSWEKFHDTAAVWRTVKPDVKSKYNQRDLRDPQVRAETCNNCHIGNIGQGKFVTHEMYAAGHPPLLGIEVMAYSRDQQMHYAPPETRTYIAGLTGDEALK